MEWLTPEVIASVGFPAGVCVYLLIKLDGTLKELTKSVSCNNALVRALLVKMGVELDVVQDVG